MIKILKVKKNSATSYGTFWHSLMSCMPVATLIYPLHFTDKYFPFEPAIVLTIGVL